MMLGLGVKVVMVAPNTIGKRFEAVADFFDAPRAMKDVTPASKNTRTLRKQRHVSFLKEVLDPDVFEEIGQKKDDAADATVYALYALCVDPGLGDQ